MMSMEAMAKLNFAQLPVVRMHQAARLVDIDANAAVSIRFDCRYGRYMSPPGDVKNARNRQIVI